MASCSSWALSAVRFTGVLLRPGVEVGQGAESVYNRLAGPTQAGIIMCGIIGYLDKRGDRGKPVGQVLLDMLQALSCRGPDSAGVAVFGPSAELRLHLSAPAGVGPDAV